MSFCAMPMVAANKGGGRADDRHDKHRRGRVSINRRTANDHVNAGSDHCRRVNQSRNRSGTGHRVRQPNVKRNLRALAGRADEKKNGDRSNAAGK